MKNKCKIKKCKNYVRSLGLCSKHYTRKRRYGITDKPKTNYDIYAEPQPTASFNDLPSQFTWYNFGGDWTTPARDQGSCGSCWAFSALSIVEASINIASALEPAC